MELLFNNQRQVEVDLPESASTLRDVLPWIRDNLLADKPELFMAGDSMYAALHDYRLLFIRRPGVLVLINDADWELEGELEYQVRPNDQLVFISTLHGG